MFIDLIPFNYALQRSAMFSHFAPDGANEFVGS